MTVEIGEPRIRIAKKSRDMFYESEVSAVTFIKRIKVDNVKLADVDRPDIIEVQFTDRG